MDTLQGRVTRIRHTAEVTGNSSRTRTVHIAVLELGDVLVTFRSAAPALIEDGDEVRIVGYTDEGGRTLEAVAFHNLTRDVVDDNVPQPGCAGAVGCITAAAVAGVSAVPLFTREPLLPMLREMVPLWLPVVVLVPLLVALLIDRRRAAERRDVLALLEG
ncbi:MAG TPA: hypothetical protein VEX86_16230 [Longimicrobium sp.]|nr:hypothetical protein [Longimicrobium sp.]